MLEEFSSHNNSLKSGKTFKVSAINDSYKYGDAFGDLKEDDVEDLDKKEQSSSDSN